MTLRRRAGLALALALPLALTACASSGDAAPAAEEPSGDTVSIAHAMGETEVACTPERVVTLGQGETDSTIALGVTPVGVVSPWTDDWYEYLPDEVEQAEVVGTEIEPDLEAIAALQPDLILGSKLRHEALYDQLSQIAPTVFTETIGVAWKENVGTYAEALCLEDEGERIVADYQERAAEIGQALDTAGQGDTEVSIIRFMPDQVRIYLTGFPGSVIRDAGLERPEPQRVEDWEASEQLIEISEERIPEMDGDVIFEMVSAEHYAQQGTQTIDEQIERWTSTDLWQGLSAVQAGDVVVVDESHWNLGGGIGAANALLADLEAHFADAA
ncbi:ABC transporter substrate-binding protein [Microbacterium karelineae]|uniref:ABC transporter substrate-binding protein n=1 Tax=Microbacterium karelineae TaxID=2654283 RepID=UPI0018D4BCF6|nr:iron-siderophore ABC transporter substrate-binding protein [Microbacterium karelineae]